MLDLLQQALHHRLGVSLDSHHQRIVAAQFLWVDFYLDDFGVGWDVSVVVEGGGLAETGSHGQDDVGLAHGLDAFLRAQSAQVA